MQALEQKRASDRIPGEMSFPQCGQDRAGLASSIAICRRAFVARSLQDREQNIRRCEARAVAAYSEPHHMHSSTTMPPLRSTYQSR